MAGHSESESKSEDGGDGVEVPKKKVAGKKIILIVVVLLVLAGAAVAGLYFTGKLGGHGEETAAEGEAHGEKKAEHGEKKAEHGAKEGEHGEKKGEGETEGDGLPVFYDVPQILVNLQSDRKRSTFLRLKVSLQLNSEADKDAVAAVLPRVVDSFQMYLRELTRDEMQGTAGLERLREELRLRVSAAIAPIEIKDVLFTEMIFGD